jgi:3'-phosphoadenosine 5'-phosphosulfate sulfotransferase
MGKFNSFEEINSWQKARIFNKRIYEITDNQNFKKDFDLVRQIRRASISISSNIAEGFERNTDKEFVYTWKKIGEFDNMITLFQYNLYTPLIILLFSIFLRFII